MILHHCFLDPERLHNDYISVFGSYQFLETRIAWAGKICVAIYAFLSGYAFSLKRARQQKPLKNLIYDYRFVLTQGIKFYSKVLMVVCVFLPIGILFYNRKSSLLCFLQSIFLGKYINGEWWYIRKYLVFLLTFPLIAFILSLIETLLSRCRKRITQILLCAICSSVLLVVIWNPISDTGIGRLWEHLLRSTLGNYYLIFLEGVLVSRYGLFYRLHRFLDRHFPFPSLVMVFSIIGVFLLLLIRGLVVQDPTDTSVDLIIAPIFIYLSVGVCHFARKKCLSGLFSYFGRYSTYMWLTHTFFLYYYWQSVVLLPKYSVLIYLWTVLLSLLTALVLDGFYRILHHLILAFARKCRVDAYSAAL